MCDEEMHEWLDARQKDLHTRESQDSEVERVPAPTDGVAVHPCARGEVISHCCGLNVRVGEVRVLREADALLMILHRTRSLCWHVIGMLFLALVALLPMQHNWMFRGWPSNTIPGLQSAVRVQMEQVWEVPSTMI